MITKPKGESSYTDYYVKTLSIKLSEPVDVKKLIQEEVLERNSVHGLRRPR